MLKDAYLVISDLQAPFEHEKALEFCYRLKKHYKIPDENVLNVGDETDSYHGGRWPKDPDGRFSAVGELGATREKMRLWGDRFPKMKLAISNHGLRWVRKAAGAEIPTELLRSYQEIFQMPEKWVWKPEWRFENLKSPFRMIHGMGYSGVQGHRNAAIDAGISTVIGHLHSHAAISYIRTGTQKIWGFNTGCLINPEDYAFSYGKEARLKPCLGAGLIFDSGRTPMWIPLD